MPVEQGVCPAFHKELDQRCEGPNDGHTNHYFTTYVEWECCALCGGEREPVYKEGKYTGRDEIQHRNVCPTLPMTRERAEALLECRCPAGQHARGVAYGHVECLYHAASALPEEEADRLEDAARQFLERAS